MHPHTECLFSRFALLLCVTVVFYLTGNGHVLSFFRTNQFAAHRSFVYWVHEKLGRKRKVIPSCVVGRIRQAFPEQDNTYEEFHESLQISYMLY